MQPKITKPTLLINEEVVRKNIKKMSLKASKNNIILRPHFKTHQSSSIGEWFLDAGITNATVSSVEMAQYFVEAGWKDITIAFPYNPLEYQMIEKIGREVKLNLVIVSKEALDHLNKYVSAPVRYYIKVDVGSHRTGVMPEDRTEIAKIAQSKNNQHRLGGLLAHAGHSYKPLNREKALKIYMDGIQALQKVQSVIGQGRLKISWGDTPTCSMLDEFPSVDELRPGNFVFYDLMQYQFNTCSIDEIAICMACPVVSVHPNRAEAVIYGGSVHFSLDSIHDNFGQLYGQVVELTPTGWNPVPAGRLVRLSQEHGVIQGPRKFIESLELGKLIGVLPVHACLTADLQSSYLSLSGDKLSKLNRSDE